LDDQDPVDKEVKEEMLVQEDRLVHWDQKDLEVKLVQEDLVVKEVILDWMEIKVNEVKQVHLAQKDQLAQRDHLVPMVQLVK